MIAHYLSQEMLVIDNVGLDIETVLGVIIHFLKREETLVHLKENVSSCKTQESLDG